MAIALIALVAPFFAGGVGALESGQPSKTSIMVAGCRAFASHDPDPSIRNPDWLAEEFIGPQERALIPESPSIKALSMPYEEGLKNGSIGVCRMMLIRTRFIDDRLKEAVDAGAKQIVILGAGFDSRAYRLRGLLANTHVIEVDYGPTQ
jgi:methyltransferase (TIGR00027 family)